VINPGTGKQSSRHTAFGDLGWGHAMWVYLQSINTKLDTHAMHIIMDQVKEFANVSQNPRDSESKSAFINGVNMDNDQAQLADGSGSSSDEFDIDDSKDKDDDDHSMEAFN